VIYPKITNITNVTLDYPDQQVKEPKEMNEQ